MYSAALRERGKNTHSTELSSTELEVTSRFHACLCQKGPELFIASYFAVRDQSLTLTGGHLGFRCSCHLSKSIYLRRGGVEPRRTLVTASA